MGQQDAIIALKAQGRSVRAIAAQVGLSKSQVQRVLQAQADAPGASVAVPAAGVVLTLEELAYMGWSEAHVAAGLNELEEYRLQAVMSYRVSGSPLPEPERSSGRGPLTKHERDNRILELRAEGYTLQAIADELDVVPKMTKAGVGKALVRLLDTYDEDDLEEDVPSVPAGRRQRFGGASRAGWRDTEEL